MFGIPHPDGVGLIASNFGGAKHPAWYHNLKANPEATSATRLERKRTSTAGANCEASSVSLTTSEFTSRGGGIRTHDLFVPNEARYQAAPHPA